MCRTMIATLALITLASCRTVSGPEPAARVPEQSVALGGRLSSSDDSALPKLTNLRAIRSVDRRWGHVLRISANVAPHSSMPSYLWLRFDTRPEGTGYHGDGDEFSTAPRSVPTHSDPFIPENASINGFRHLPIRWFADLYNVYADDYYGAWRGRFTWYVRDNGVTFAVPLEAMGNPQGTIRVTLLANAGGNPEDPTTRMTLTVTVPAAHDNGEGAVDGHLALD